MAHAIISLPGSTVAWIRVEADDSVQVRFAPALVVKSQGIAGVDPSTRWSQEGLLTLREAEIAGAPPAGAALVAGGSMECGGFKYLEMVPLPLADAPGFAELRLRFPEVEVVVTGQDPRFAPQGQACYLGPLEPGAAGR